MRRIITSVFAIVALLSLAPRAAHAKSFRWVCGFSHRAQVDPIVSPGAQSMHMHDFFANRSTSSTSTYTSMVSSGTTCTRPKDTAAYWVPTLYRGGGKPVTPMHIRVYYSNEPTGHRIRAFPRDFRMIAGYPHRFDRHPNSFWGWACDNYDRLSRTIAGIDCRGRSGSDRYIAARIFMPMCGRRDSGGKILADSADHRSHVVYPVRHGVETSRQGHCPANHPVQLPRIRVIVKWPLRVCRHCYLASDGMASTRGGASLHADFWNTWRQAGLRRLVRQLNRSLHR